MAKGDRIRIMTDKEVLVAEAQQNGRTVDYDFEKDGGIAWIIVSEKTRGGTVINEIRVQTDRVIALHVQKKEISRD